MAKTVNQDDNPAWYDLDKLRADFMWHGHDNYGVQASQILGLTKPVCERKINHGKLEHEETIMLAKALHMPLKMYCKIFLKGVYDEEDTPE